MKCPKLRVAVIGCGAAGASSAIFLKRSGHDAVVFEQASECRPVGAGFLLQPSGFSVLRELGLEKCVLGHASVVRRLRVEEKAGRELMELSYAEVGRDDFFGAGVHRPMLMEALIREMAREGIEVRWGRRIETAERTVRGWRIGGEEFDLLVVADGARSAMRRKLAGEGRNHGYEWGAHWFIGRNRGVFASDALYQVVDGTRRMTGFLPTGREWGAEDVPENEMISLFWSIRIADDAWIRRRPLAEWKEGILDLCPAAEELLNQIEDWDQVLTARYGDVKLGRWHRDRVVFIGDAGHAMSPQLGQGVNLALEDALCLADCVKAFPLEGALKMYSRRRGPVLRYYQYATRWLTPWFQSDHEFLTPWRRSGFGIAGEIAPLRRLMTLSMAGQMRAF